MNTLPTSDTKCYDNTRISTYKVCPRSYYLRHIRGWTIDSKYESLALTFGSCWHDAQDIVWGHAKKFGHLDLTELSTMAFKKTWLEKGLKWEPGLSELDAMQPRTPGNAKEMLYNYIGQRWDLLQRCKVVAIEQPFAVPIPGMLGHWYIGRLDKVIDDESARHRNRLVVEHKSTTAYATIGNFRPDFIESFGRSSQVKGYQFGGSLFYGNVDSVWVDAALVHKKVHDAFKFIPVSYSPDILVSWVDNMTTWVAQISTEEEELKQNDNKLAPGMFKENEESCFGKYGPCAFIDICRSIPDPSKLEEPPPGYIEKRWEPFSILGLSQKVKE